MDHTGYYKHVTGLIGICMFTLLCEEWIHVRRYIMSRI